MKATDIPMFLDYALIKAQAIFYVGPEAANIWELADKWHTICGWCFRLDCHVTLTLQA